MSDLRDRCFSVVWVEVAARDGDASVESSHFFHRQSHGHVGCVVQISGAVVAGDGEAVDLILQ